MAESSNGGDVPSRAERLERLIEVLANRHIDFEEEHKHLLRAQVVMADQLQELTALQRHTDERLNALLAVVDDPVRRNRPSQ